jgi:hypothetical protein
MIKKKLKYQYVNFDSLRDLLIQGISQVAIQKGSHGRPDFVWFRLGNELVIKIRSVVSSVDSWDEIGSLVFELVNEHDMDKNIINLSEDWGEIGGIDRLIYSDDVVDAESGIALKNINGKEIVVVSSSFPFSVELFAGFYSKDFSPECDLSKYLRDTLAL